MNEKTIADFSTIAFGAFGTYFSLQDLDSVLSIVMTILCIISSCIAIVLRVIDRVKKAKEDDGKISLDEAQQIMIETKEDLDEVTKHGKR